MDAKKYKYRREDTGEIIEVPWSVMIDQDAGFITLEDGTLARRCLHLEETEAAPKDTKKRSGTRTIVSDALGFGQHQLADFEKDRRKNGFPGVEFVRDPAVPEFFQVKCGSREEFNRYTKHRGMVNKGGVGGVRLSKDEMARAEALARRMYPCA